MQNLIPDVWQVVFAYVSIQGWIIDNNNKTGNNISQGITSAYNMA